MSSDAKWVIGTLGGLILAVAGLLSAQIGGQIAGVHTRICLQQPPSLARPHTGPRRSAARLVGGMEVGIDSPRRLRMGWKRPRPHPGLNALAGEASWTLNRDAVSSGPTRASSQPGRAGTGRGPAFAAAVLSSLTIIVQFRDAT